MGELYYMTGQVLRVKTWDTASVERGEFFSVLSWVGRCGRGGYFQERVCACALFSLGSRLGGRWIGGCDVGVSSTITF